MIRKAEGVFGYYMPVVTGPSGDNRVEPVYEHLWPVHTAGGGDALYLLTEVFQTFP